MDERPFLLIVATTKPDHYNRLMALTQSASHIRFSVAASCLLGYVLILFSPVLRYEGMDLTLFRWLNDILGNILLSSAMLLLTLPTPSEAKAGVCIGLFSVLNDWFVETLGFHMNWWHTAGGHAFPPFFPSPVEMYVGFFWMGLTVACLTTVPRNIREAKRCRIPGLVQLFQNPRRDPMWLFAVTPFLAWMGAQGDFHLVSYGLFIVKPGWSIWGTFLVWWYGLVTGLLVFYACKHHFEKSSQR